MKGVKQRRGRAWRRNCGREKARDTFPRNKINTELRKEFLILIHFHSILGIFFANPEDNQTSAEGDSGDGSILNFHYRSHH